MITLLLILQTIDISQSMQCEPGKQWSMQPADNENQPDWVLRQVPWQCGKGSGCRPWPSISILPIWILCVCIPNKHIELCVIRMLMLMIFCLNHPRHLHAPPQVAGNLANIETNLRYVNASVLLITWGIALCGDSHQRFGVQYKGCHNHYERSDGDATWIVVLPCRPLSLVCFFAAYIYTYKNIYLYI